ncbi:hypothetical protein Cgig2_001639 [Carnegiea gigantea]|uniref:Uncharacterized protein n=1 Tax=Carnegiea gigantea TaxID=171969 RepID=A0A9Q1GXD8_9CARY|nr:hypothetical protein Cgig2_001639 [Carnegiea gigantea]
MSTMTGTIMQQISKQVKKAVEAVSSAWPLPCFKYVPAAGCEPFYRHAPVASHHHSGGRREAPCADRNDRSRAKNCDSSVGAKALHSHRPSHGRPVRSTTASTPYATHSRRSSWFEDARAPYADKATPDDLSTKALKRKGHTTAKCRELRKALHELADKGQIGRFLKKGPHFLLEEHEPVQPEPWDEECSMEIVATIARGYVEDITRFSWKAQLQGAQQVITAEQSSQITVPTMVFDGEKGPCFTSLHNDPLVVEMKVAIITWDCLRKLKYSEREIVPLVHPILGFGGQEKREYKHQ